MVEFIILTGAILIAGPIHHGGAQAIKDHGLKASIEKAWDEAKPLVSDHTGNYGNP